MLFGSQRVSPVLTRSILAMAPMSPQQISLHLLVLLALEGVETAELFGVAGGGVVEGHIAGDLAADDLDEGELAVLVGNVLKTMAAVAPFSS